MNASREAGAAFVSGLLTDCEVLTERVQGLDLALEEERKCRAESTDGAFKRILEIDEAFSNRSDQFDVVMTKWTATIEAVSLQCNSLSTRMQAQIQELAERQAAMESKCVQADEFARQITRLEESAAVKDKSDQADFGRLSSTLACLREEIRHSRASQEAAEDRFQKETQLLQKDINKMATAADLSQVSVKCETLEAHMYERALAAEVSALEARLAGTEASIQAATVEIMRSVSDELQPVRQSISNLSTEAGRTQASLHALDAIVAPLPQSIKAVSSSVKSLERRHESESDRTNTCWISLQNELASKVARSEFDPLGTRLDKVEQSNLVHLTNAKANGQQLKIATSRIDALDTTCNAKADCKTLENVKSILTNQAARQNELQGMTESKIESLSSQMHTFVTKSLERMNKQHTTLVDDVQGQLKQLQDEFHADPCGDKICTKAFMEQELLQFYPRHEMDALLARVWWRLGQTGKVVGAASPLTNWHTVTKPAEAKPERPQSARSTAIARLEHSRPVRPQSARSEHQVATNCLGAF